MFEEAQSLFVHRARLSLLAGALNINKISVRGLRCDLPLALVHSLFHWIKMVAQVSWRLMNNRLADRMVATRMLSFYPFQHDY